MHTYLSSHYQQISEQLDQHKNLQADFQEVRADLKYQDENIQKAAVSKGPRRKSLKLDNITVTPEEVKKLTEEEQNGAPVKKSETNTNNMDTSQMQMMMITEMMKNNAAGKMNEEQMKTMLMLIQNMNVKSAPPEPQNNNNGNLMNNQQINSAPQHRSSVQPNNYNNFDPIDSLNSQNFSSYNPPPLSNRGSEPQSSRNNQRQSNFPFDGVPVTNSIVVTNQNSNIAPASYNGNNRNHLRNPSIPQNFNQAPPNNSNLINNNSINNPNLLNNFNTVNAVNTGPSNNFNPNLNNRPTNNINSGNPNTNMMNSNLNTFNNNPNPIPPQNNGFTNNNPPNLSNFQSTPVVHNAFDQWTDPTSISTVPRNNPTNNAAPLPQNFATVNNTGTNNNWGFGSPNPEPNMNQFNSVNQNNLNQNSNLLSFSPNPGPNTSSIEFSPSVGGGFTDRSLNSNPGNINSFQGNNFNMNTNPGSNINQFDQSAPQWGAPPTTNNKAPFGGMSNFDAFSELDNQPVFQASNQNGGLNKNQNIGFNNGFNGFSAQPVNNVPPPNNNNMMMTGNNMNHNPTPYNNQPINQNFNSNQKPNQSSNPFQVQKEEVEEKKGLTNFYEQLIRNSARTKVQPLRAWKQQQQSGTMKSQNQIFELDFNRYHTVYQEKYPNPNQSLEKNSGNQYMNVRQSHFALGYQNQLGYTTSNVRDYQKHENPNLAVLNKEQLNELRSSHFSLGQYGRQVATMTQLMHDKKEIVPGMKEAMEQQKMKMRSHNHVFAESDQNVMGSVYTKEYGKVHDLKDVGNLNPDQIRQRVISLRTTNIILGNQGVPFKTTNKSHYLGRSGEQRQSFNPQLQNTHLHLGDHQTDYISNTQLYHYDKPYSKVEMPEETRKDLRTSHFVMGQDQNRWRSQSVDQYKPYGNNHNPKSVNLNLQQNHFALGDPQTLNVYQSQYVQSMKAHPLGSNTTQIRDQSKDRSSQLDLGNHGTNYATQFSSHYQHDSNGQPGSLDKELQDNLRKHHFKFEDVKSGKYVTTFKAEYPNSDNLQAGAPVIDENLKNDLRSHHFGMGSLHLAQETTHNHFYTKPEGSPGLLNREKLQDLRSHHFKLA